LIDIPDKRYRDKLQYELQFWQTYDLLKEGRTRTEVIKLLWPDEYQKGNERSESEIQAKYNELVERYEKQGVEDWGEKAYKDSFEKNKGINLKLYTRVRDHEIKAEKKIEELRLRFKVTP
jgi:hypothetical protein